MISTFLYMKKNWKSRLFKFFFSEFYYELEDKTRKVKTLNEINNERTIELNTNSVRMNKLVEEVNSLRDENKTLYKELEEAKKSIIESNEYKTLLEKYNELLNEK